MVETAKSNRKGVSNRPASWSSALEVALTMLLVAALFAGAVLLCGRAVSHSTGASGDPLLDGEAKSALHDIELMAASSSQTRLLEDPPGGTVAPGITYPAVELLADLDGDGSSGSFRAGDATGLERVLVFRSPENGRLLIARVWDSSDSLPEDVVLASTLDPDDPEAFGAKSKRGTDGGAGIEITLRLESGSVRATFSAMIPEL